MSLYIKDNGAWLGFNSKAAYRKENGQWVERSLDELDKNYIYKYISSAESFNYVSLGDSIAAGHTINAEWSSDYGEGSQYGKNGNTETVIVPGCYTDIIRSELVSVYGAENISVKSFARSGDTVADLMDKLSHDVVRNAIAKANLVTVCIGANDVLQPAMTHLDEYISTGSLASAEAVIEANFTRLSTDSEPTSFTALFNKLNEINPNAIYMFTTIYNPYKYLYLDEGTNGFFGPLLGTIPEMNLDIDGAIEDAFNIDDLGYYDVLDLEWVSIELNFDADEAIKNGLLSVPIVQQLFNRVNNLGGWSEVYVNRLNQVLKSKIESYNPNFAIAETKAIFDLFPDKTDSTSDVDYSDLVSVEFTHIFNTAKMDWGALWRNSNATSFWTSLAWDHISLQTSEPYFSFDLEGLAADLVEQIIDKVILPDTDPHPEPQGHQVLKRSFTNALGLVKYETNDISGVVALHGVEMTHAKTTRLGYTFDGWYTDADFQHSADGAEFTDYDADITLADLVDGASVKQKIPKTTRLYAKWSAND